MSSSSREPPPALFPWEEPLESAPLAFIDLEMTGLDAKRHRVIEICLERVVGSQVVDRLESLVKPEPLLDNVGNHHVHGIGADDLRGAPTFTELAPRVLELLDGAAMVAHGARWDAAFLHAEMQRSGASWNGSHHIDTLALSRRLMQAERYALASLAESLAIPNDNPHRAANDVSVTKSLFAHLVDLTRAADHRRVTPRVLWERCVGKSVVKPAILEAAESAIGHGELMAVCYRASRGGLQQLSFVVTDIRRDLDPPVVLGYLHLTRGRRELRADRILSLDRLEK